MDNKEALKSYLNILMKRTIDKEIIWTKINPSTFQWSQDIEQIEHVASIQKISAPNFASLLSGKVESFDKYVFQVIEKNKNEVKLTILSEDKFKLHADLKNLYDSIEGTIDSVSVEVFKNLLGL